MPLLNFFRRKKKAVYRSIAVLQRHQMIHAFTPTLRKRSIVHRLVQTQQHTHMHKVQKLYYQLHVTANKYQHIPIYVQRLGQQGSMLSRIIYRTEKQHQVLPMTRLQRLSDTLVKNSIKKEQEYYRYHPEMARRTAWALLDQISLQNKWQPATFPKNDLLLSYAVLPKQIHRQLKQKLEEPQLTSASTYVKKEEKPKHEKIRQIYEEEYHVLVEEICRSVEQHQKKERRRRGR